MTKFKSKKITKSTIAVIIMAIAMVAMLAFGGTYALFTATSNTKTRDITTGVVKLKSGSIVTTALTGVVPGDTILGAVTYDAHESTVDTYIAVKIEFKKGNVALTSDEMSYLSFATPTGWTAATTAGVYVKTAKVAANTSDPVAFCDAITFDAHARYTENAAGNGYDYVIGDEEAAEPATSPVMEGITFTISVTGYSVQAKNIGDVAGINASTGAIESSAAAEAIYQLTQETKLGD